MVRGASPGKERMPKTTTKRRGSRTARPRGSAFISIQHERWVADRWKVMLHVNGVSFAIGAECDSRDGSERLCADFQTALTALGVKIWPLPNASVTGAGTAYRARGVGPEVTP